MEIKEEHKALLMEGLGLKEEDFEQFDGRFVLYEYDRERGVRIYDPYYRTSYKEYIGIDGWSAWSSEGDTFMSDILEGVHGEVQRRIETSPQPAEGEIQEAMRRKFEKEDKKPSE